MSELAGVGHSALRQDPYKSMLEEFKTAPNTFLFLQSVKAIIQHQKPDSPDIQIDGESINHDAQKARKTKLEADKLEDEKNLRRDNWAPIAEMEAEWLKQFREVMELSQETFDDLKSRFELSAEQIQEVDLAFAEKMNKIASAE